MNHPEYIKVNGKEYKINTNFKVAIECNSIAEDKTIGDYERALAIIYKLFGSEALNDTENHVKLLELAQRYLLCGKSYEEKKEEPDMDFVEDYNLIWASIYSDYNGLDIDKENIHWWKFNDLINGLSYSELGNCCVLNRIRSLRTFDEKTIKDKKERDKIIEAKKKVALKKNKKENNLSKEQEESMANLNKLLKL